MIRHGKKRPISLNEDGSSIVQSVLVIPFIAIIAIFIIQLAIVSFESSVVSSQVSRAIATADMHSLYTDEQAHPGTAKTKLENTIRSSVPALSDKEDDLFRIENFNIELNPADPDGKNYRNSASTSDPDETIKTIKKEQSVVRVTGTLHYKMPRLFAYTVFDNMEITRDIDMSQTSSSRFEFTQDPTALWND